MCNQDNTRITQARPLFVVICCLIVSLNGKLAESAEPPISDAEQAIRARIVADNKAIAAVRKAVAAKLEKACVKQFLDPAAELPIAHKTDAPEGRWVLWYQQPGSFWTDAIPLENGRLGAMVFGGVRIRGGYHVARWKTAGGNREIVVRQSVPDSLRRGIA